MMAEYDPRPSGDGRPLDGSDIPLPPVVKPDEIWLGTPNVLVEGRYSIGWQGRLEQKGGPSFVTVRRSALGTLKIVERYPLTEEGWAQAWRALVKLDSAMAQKILPVLAQRVEKADDFARRRKLYARSLAFLPLVVFIGGYLSEGELTAGQACELWFLEDRLSVFRQGSLKALVEFTYADVQAVEVGGPGLVKRWSPVHQAMLTAAFGLTGALVGYGSTRIKTFVRIQTAGSELFFLHTTLLPDDLRIHLSRGLGAVREAQTSAASSGDEGKHAGSASQVDELSRLAGFLEKGLLTREEFDQLKAKLITGN
jgi:hypothetical protein